MEGSAFGNESWQCGEKFCYLSNKTVAADG